MPNLYQGSYHCTRCGFSSNDTHAEWLPVILAEFGVHVKLRCQICDNVFLQIREVSVNG